MDKLEFYEICTKSGLKVNKGVCATFIKQYNTIIYSDLRADYLKRLGECLRPASNVAQRALTCDWDDANVLGGIIPHDSGTTHVTAKSLFGILGGELQKLHQMVSCSLEHNVREPRILGIRQVNGHFEPIWQELTSVSASEKKDGTLFPSLISKTGRKRVQSDEIMFLLYFWLEHGGKCTFSASSRFANFCSKCLPTENGKQISPSTLEKRFHNMNLPELCKLFL